MGDPDSTNGANGANGQSFTTASSSVILRESVQPARSRNSQFTWYACFLRRSSIQRRSHLMREEEVVGVSVNRNIFGLFLAGSMSTFLIFTPFLVNAAGPAPQDLLEKSDRARGGLSKGMSWKITIASKQGGNTSETGFEVKVKELNVLAKCVAPPRQKDEIYLFNDRNLWVFRPGLRKPISVSPRQRLSGQAANGDIATTNYARDYEGKLLGEDKVNGTPAYRLELKAKGANTTYDSINYWISKDKILGIKAEFLTAEGQVFKSAVFEYKNSIAANGKQTPFISKMIITDAAFANNMTTLEYTNPSAASLNDTIFNVNNLAR